jgi:hypothetical protein
MAAAGFYTVQDGAGELLTALLRTSAAGPNGKTAGASGPFELLGDSRRESMTSAHAAPVEFKGIRVKDWVVGSNKTHITPVESLDRCVGRRLKGKRA